MGITDRSSTNSATSALFKMKLSVTLLSMMAFIVLICNCVTAASPDKQKDTGGFTSIRNTVRENVKAHTGQSRYNYGKRHELMMNQRSIFDDDQLERTIEAICLELAQT